MSDNNEISIEGIAPGAVLAALHNNTRALGMGMLHDIGRTMTVEEATKELAEWPKFDGGWRFDYFHGRPLKVSFDEKTLRGVRLYDRDAGEGACARAIEEARKAVRS